MHSGISVAGAPVFQEAQLVVAEQGGGAIGAFEVEDFAAVRAAVDESAQEDEPVVAGQRELAQQLGKLGVAPVDVADGDKTSVHAAEKC